MNLAHSLLSNVRKLVSLHSETTFMTVTKPNTDLQPKPITTFGDNLQACIIDAITDRKGRDISIVDMTHIESAPLSQFIIAEGSSTTNVAAIADHVREKVQELTGIKPYNYDGYKASEWIVIDYGHLLVHIFLPETRSRYRLEELWSDAAITDLPNE